MKILLINSPVWLTAGHPISESPPVGLLYLAAVLEKAGHRARVLDPDVLKMDLDELGGRLREMNPEAIGIGSTTLGLPSLSKVVSLCEKILPQAKIIAGGAGVAVEPQKTLEENKGIDAVFIGEAEESLPRWLKAVRQNESWEKIGGIAFLKDNRFIQTETQGPPGNLDTVPFPAYHLLEPKFEKYHGVANVWEGIDLPNAVIMGSRGCPHRCIFCSNKTRLVRRRSPENIVDEIELYRSQFGAKSVQFYDNEFIGMTGDQNEWVKEVCREIIRRGLDKLGYLAQGRCNRFIDLETLQLMRRAGFKWIWWGAESGSDRILKIVKKDITVQEIKRALRLARQSGIKSLMFLMVGFPGETKKDVILSAKLIKEARPDRVHCHIVTPLPGSELWDYALAHGLIDEFDYSKYDMKNIVVHHTENWSRDDIREMYELLSFRFSRGYGYLAKVFFQSLFSFDGIKKLPGRLKKAGRHSMLWLGKHSII